MLLINIHVAFLIFENNFKVYVANKGSLKIAKIMKYKIVNSKILWY
jgi:hypothetical protein